MNNFFQSPSIHLNPLQSHYNQTKPKVLTDTPLTLANQSTKPCGVWS
jgi:hypothetical protein